MKVPQKIKNNTSIRSTNPPKNELRISKTLAL
jgi:hypothetical protein